VGRKPYFDFAVIGSGFSGSIMAMVLRRLGHSVLLLERGTHPRFAIGESSTPFANLLLETLAVRHDLPFLKELSEWGSWQRNHPLVSAGLKRGFTFFHHTLGEPVDFADRSRQLLVAASPNDSVADTHWYRPEFDLFLVQQAQKLGVSYRDRFVITELDLTSERWTIASEREGFTAGFLIDASGPGSVLAEKLGIPDSGFDSMRPTRAVYAHFKNVAPLAGFEADPPYPPESAAVHHVFAKGWAWVLRFNNGITSAGAAYHGPAQTWEDILRALPTLRAQFGTAETVTPFFQTENLWFRRARAVGTRHALLPSAAAFVDPLLSTGFALTLLGVLRLADVFQSGGSDLSGYERATFLEADAVADLVGALYAKIHSFPEFTRLAMPYFAAMSFTETCWRLGKTEAASGFLLTNDAVFTSARKRLCEAARRGEFIAEADVSGAIEPFDVAGLTKSHRGNWHPVDLQDLVVARHKVGATMAELEALFQKLGVV
jgi:FADH2 O2-dependent halogenase